MASFSSGVSNCDSWSISNFIFHSGRSDSGSLHIKQQLAEEIKVIKIKRNTSAGEDGETILFDDLEYLGKLGGGNAGLVTKVRNKKTNVCFALKQMELDGKHINIKNVLAEYNSMHQNSCPYIMTMYGAFYREPSVYMLLEYMDCGSLETLLRAVGKIPEDVLAKIAIQLLKGLKFLHEVKTTVHRDLKPANILIHSRGEVKISDFGLAGHRPASGATGSQGGGAPEFTTYAGTLSYMSPERIDSSGRYGLSSDIWSFGLTLAECALGYFPYRDKVDEFWGFMRAVTEEKVQLEDHLSPEFKKFIWDCMSVVPEERPTASQLLHYDFITKYKSTEPSFRRWLHEHYVLPKKRAAEEKKNARKV